MLTAQQKHARRAARRTAAVAARNSERRPRASRVIVPDGMRPVDFSVPTDVRAPGSVPAARAWLSRSAAMGLILIGFRRSPKTP